MSLPGSHDVHPEVVNHLADGIIHKGWGVHPSGGCIGGPPLTRVPTAWQWALAYRAVAERREDERDVANARTDSALSRCDHAIHLADQAIGLTNRLLDERDRR